MIRHLYVRRGSSTTVWLTLLASLLIATPPAVASVTDPVAVVVQLRGAVHLVRADSAQQLAVAVGTTLGVGDRLLLSPPAEAALLHASGRVELITRTTIVAAPSAAAEDGLLRRALRTLRQVASTDLRQQPNREGMIRPLPGATVAVSPRNGIAVARSRPVFTWTALPGTARYRIQITGEDGPPVRYTTGRDTVWSLPANEPPLPSGLYRWTVVAEPGGRPAAVQHFRVAEPATLAAVDRAFRASDETGLDPGNGRLLLQAIIYRDVGLLYDAREALDRLDAAELRLDRGVHLLRAEVLDGLGDLDGAAEALARADEPRR